MARSLNKVELIGNLTRDPELRYTPSGAAVCTFGLATNRQWTLDSGDKKEEVEFHRIVAWNKLAELCAQLLAKGRKVYIEGRLQTRRWTAQDGTEKLTTEIVIKDMIILDSRGAPTEATKEDYDVPEDIPLDDADSDVKSEKSSSKKSKSKSKSASKKTKTKKVSKKKESNVDKGDEDIPF